MLTCDSYLSPATLDEVFEAMAEWLNCNNYSVERFGTEGSVGSIIVTAEFADDELAELFRREFPGNYGE